MESIIVQVNPNGPSRVSKLSQGRIDVPLTHNDTRFVANHILKADMKVAVLFCSEVNYATRNRYHFCSDRMDCNWIRSFRFAATRDRERDCQD